MIMILLPHKLYDCPWKRALVLACLLSISWLAINYLGLIGYTDFGKNEEFYETKDYFNMNPTIKSDGFLYGIPIAFMFFYILEKAASFFRKQWVASCLLFFPALYFFAHFMVIGMLILVVIL